MALLRIRDANGNVQEILAIRGNDGKDYVLTEADKQEIAALISGDGVDLSKYALKTDIPDLTGYALKSDMPDLTGYALKTDIPDVSKFMTEDEVLTLIQANMPVNGDEESY